MTAETLQVPDIAWVEIPAGPFLYGEGSSKRTIELPTFWIAKYPITNCQYQTFIDAGGYEEARWWKDLVKPKPEASRWPQANRPKTNVDWYEAVAFCRWLSAMLELKEDTIRLPTEQEWEKAARGE
ncbi:MAG: formylglycine-generating enzyme family protein, partial [Gammaproteobacteria bacterium]